MSGSAPTTSSEGGASGAAAGISGTRLARQASSPSVKVVSMPLPDQLSTRTAGQVRTDRRWAARARSSLMTSDGQEPHQEQQLDLGPTGEQRVDHPVEFVVHIGQARQVALVDDGRAEARLGKHHHPGRRLKQVGAGARSDHEEEGVLDLAVQPDNAGEAAEDLALAALAQHAIGIGGPARRDRQGDGASAGAHDTDPDATQPPPDAAAVAAWAPGCACCRAARNLRRNCVALTA